MEWNRFAELSLEGQILSFEQAQSVLNCPDDELLSLIQSVFSIRKKYFGKRVKLNFLLNAKSGLCPEDCNYCSQSKISSAPIDQYSFLSEKQILEAAGRAVQTHAKRFCMVNSGRGPTDPEIEKISSAVSQVKEKYPQLEVCVCLGLLKEHQADALKTCGVDAYNHNLNTTENVYSEICKTHTYQDRVETVQQAQKAGLSSCSGCLLGMGESDADRIELSLAFRRMKVESIPINFLIPIEGTPLSQKIELTPQKCLKILCLFRLINPQAEIRIAGGREIHLRWLQPLGLYIANSIFIGDYLTTQGQKPQEDISMIRDLGFEVEGYSDLDLDKLTESFTEKEFSVRLK